jgi:hypothetical protein
LDTARYNEYVQKFEKDSTQECIDMWKELEETRMQNFMTVATNRLSTVRILVRGEHAMSFVTALQDSKAPQEGKMVQMSQEYVN